MPAEGRLRPLDGLRGIAIALVISGHAFNAYFQGESGYGGDLASAVFGNAALGVRIFFVLSGYLITHLLLSEQEGTGTLFLPGFYARRAARILPAYLFFLLLMSWAAWTGNAAISPAQFANALGFAWNYSFLWHAGGPVEGQWYLGHLWTLAVEIQFYLIWPFVLLFFKRPHLRWACLLIPICMPFLRAGTYFLIPDWRGYLGIMFHTSLDGLLLGSAVAAWGNDIPKTAARLLASPWTLAAAALAAFFASPWLALTVRGYEVTAGYLLEAAAGAVMLYHALGKGLWPEFLSCRPMVALGVISYSLYLWQQPFLTQFNTSWSGRFPASLAAAMAMAFLSCYLIERPVLKKVRGILAS